MKKILKGAVVLLIAAAMVFSTVAVTADTGEEEISSACGNINKNFVGNPQTKNTNMIPFSGDRTDLFVQTPLGPDDPEANCYTSDFNLGHVVYDNFWDINEPICDIHWWGFTMLYDAGWYPCDPTGMLFAIGFFTDAGGQPGQLVCLYEDISPSITGTGVYYEWAGGYTHEMYYFEVDLDPCCELSNGWVAIQSIYSPNNCAFLWMNSKDGDLYCIQDAGSWDYDVSFILTGEETCNPDIDVEKEVFDSKTGRWVDADTASTALDAPICSNVKFRITVTNTGDCPLAVGVDDKMHDSLKYVGADPEPEEVSYDPPFYYILWVLPNYVMPGETITITVTAHVEGPDCSIDYNHAYALGVTDSGVEVEDEDYAYVHAYEKAKEINMPLLKFLQSHPNMFPFLQILLQRLELN